MDRGFPKARETRLCDPQAKRNTIATSNLERERERCASIDERECVILASYGAWEE